LDSKNELVGPKAPKKAIQWPPGSGPPLRSVESPILDADGLNPDLHWFNMAKNLTSMMVHEISNIL
jgi:hypothetical protein